MNESDLVNLYIQNLVNTVERLSSEKVLLEAKIQYHETTAKEFVDKANSLQTEYEKQNRISEVWETSNKKNEELVHELRQEVQKLRDECKRKNDTISELKKKNKE